MRALVFRRVWFAMAAVGALILAAVLASSLRRYGPCRLRFRRAAHHGAEWRRALRRLLSSAPWYRLGRDEPWSPFGPEIYRPGHHPDAAFITAVRSGVRRHHWEFGNMPSLPDPDAELAAILQFIREEQAQAGIQ